MHDKTTSDTNQLAQSQKQARDLKFWIYVEEGLYYLCSENKGTDQLRGYREAGLHLCFCICKLLVFSCGSSHAIKEIFTAKKNDNFQLKILCIY